jgi:predicted RNase H-like HicB family nuclease
MKYLIVIEKAEKNYSAYAPDLPGCVSTGRTLDEVKENMREAVNFHLDGMREEGLPIPEPLTQGEYVEAMVA